MTIIRNPEREQAERERWEALGPHGHNASLLALALEAAVPLRIARLRELGGPTEEDFRLLRCEATLVEPARPGVRGPRYEPWRGVAQLLAEKGDVLMYGGGRRGEAAEAFNHLAHALAVMSFLPGGVRFAGTCWETKA